MSSGAYSTSRKCFHCGFETTDRDEFWAHVLTHQSVEETFDVLSRAALTPAPKGSTDGR